MRFFLITSCLLFSVFALAQAPKEKKKVVIGTTIGNGVTEGEKALFEDQLGNGLIESGEYDVLQRRKEFSEVLNEEVEFQQGGLVDDNQRLELGHIKGAEYSCIATLRRINGIYSATCKFTSLKDGNLARSFTLDGQDVHSLARGMALKIARSRDLTSETLIKWVKAPKCVYDSDNDRFVDGDISRSDEGPMTYHEAVVFCRNKGEDWHLPDKNELLAIYQSRAAITENGGIKFISKDYWSSSRRNDHESYFRNFGTGQEDFYSRNIRNVFRCVR